MAGPSGDDGGGGGGGPGPPAPWRPAATLPPPSSLFPRAPGTSRASLRAANFAEVRLPDRPAPRPGRLASPRPGAGSERPRPLTSLLGSYPSTRQAWDLRTSVHSRPPQEMRDVTGIQLMSTPILIPQDTTEARAHLHSHDTNANTRDSKPL